MYSRNFRTIRMLVSSLIIAMTFGFAGAAFAQDSFEYNNAVIFSALIFIIVYPIGYQIGKNKLQKKIRELKLKKHLIEKELRN